MDKKKFLKWLSDKHAGNLSSMNSIKILQSYLKEQLALENICLIKENPVISAKTQKFVSEKLGSLKKDQKNNVEKKLLVKKVLQPISDSEHIHCTVKMLYGQGESKHDTTNANCTVKNANCKCKFQMQIQIANANCTVKNALRSGRE